MKLVYFINVDWYFCLHWLERAKAAQVLGYEIHVITRFTDTKYSDLLTSLDFQCHDIDINRSSMNPLSLINTYLKARKVIRSVRPNLMHCVTVKPNLLGGLIANHANIPCVLSVTGTGLAFSSTRIRAKISRAVIVAWYRHVLAGKNQRVIFENKDDCELFLTLNVGSPEINTVVPGAGVDVQKYAYKEPERKRDALVVLFAARMLWDKGLTDLIEASRILKNQGITITLKVAGILDEDTQAAIPEKQILEWHDAGLIDWLGSVQEMPELIGSVDVVALPTTYGEGIPRILIEAAAVGRPCITTDIPGCREIVVDGENGYLVPGKAPMEIADRLRKFVDNDELIRRMGCAGRKLVESKYEQSIVIRKIFAVYDEIIEPVSTLAVAGE